MDPDETLPADHFLSKTVEKALCVYNKVYEYRWEQNYVDAKLEDPYHKYENAVASQLSTGYEPDHHLQENPTDVERHSTVASAMTINNTVTLSDAGTVIPKPPPTGTLHAAPAFESFGVLLSQVFLILSILSKDSDFLRLPAISDLHLFSPLGYGTSFIARKIPRKYISGISDSFHPKEQFFVYKSLRHYNRQEGDENHRDVGAKRLKTILLEIQVLTHPPLRSHENIVRLIGFGWETNRINRRSHVFQWPFLVQEYAAYGSMVDAFERYPMDYRTRKSLCIDVGQGLSALHQCEIIHGDIKMENVLVFPHEDRGFIAKLADFGCTLVDLQGKARKRGLAGYSKPWNPPEFWKTMTQHELYLTDVYSYGLLIWRAMLYGHTPFTENEGYMPRGENDRMAKLKDENKVLGVALKSLEPLKSYGNLFVMVKGALENSLQLDPAQRSLASCLRSLGSQVSVSSKQPLRQVVIPQVQGLGIYGYTDHNLRLSCQLRHALESYCLSATALDWSATRMLVDNGSATLYAEYLVRHVSGDVWDKYHRATSRSLALSWLSVSAGTGQTSSSEALFPVFSAFASVDAIPNVEALSVGAALGLIDGSEFILTDIINHSLPRKHEFMEAFRTRFCRGVGITLGIPKEAFDGSGSKRFSEYLGEPFMGSKGLKGVITPEYLLRIAAAWGCLSAVISISSAYNIEIDSEDFYGESALLKACRAGHSDVVRWLVVKGRAKGNISTKKGITPLHWLSSFDENDIEDVAKLLKASGADPNAVAVNNDDDIIERAYFFFKGPPLIRVVASGNITAVRALLDIGADPTLREGTGESPIVFAARRLRVEVLRLLLERAAEYPVWRSTPGGASLVRYVITSPPAYGAKIHGEGYFKALDETFDFLWSKYQSPGRLFHAISTDGLIPIQLAVQEGNMPLTKKIINSCPKEGHLKELVATIGLQTAILWGREAIFLYLLEQGAQPLHPFLEPNSKEVDQFQPYVLDGPWTMDLARHQRKTTSLHLCTRAGDRAAIFGKRLLEVLLPPSRWDKTPEHLRNEGHINCCSVNGPLDDPIVDCRDEYDRTPFFCALKAEEYELAYQLCQAGANKNALVVHPAVHKGNPMRFKPDVNGLPIVEHALTWVSAFRAMEFLIHDCWGCLRLTNSYGDELRTGVIEETAKWPLEEARIVFNYIAKEGYNSFRWDKELILAIECLNEAAVESILQKREAIPQHSTPQALYDTIRRTLLKRFSGTLPENSGPTAVFEHREKRMDTCKRAMKILSLIRESYRNHNLGGSQLLEYPQLIISAVRLELTVARTRYVTNSIGPEKLINEVDKIMAPWMMVMGALASPAQLLEVQENLRTSMGDEVRVVWYLDEGGKGLCREQTKPLLDDPQTGTQPSALQEEFSPPGCHSVLERENSGAVSWLSSSGDNDTNQASLPAVGHQSYNSGSVRSWMREKLQGRLRMPQLLS